MSAPVTSKRPAPTTAAELSDEYLECRARRAHDEEVVNNPSWLTDERGRVTGILEDAICRRCKREVERVQNSDGTVSVIGAPKYEDDYLAERGHRITPREAREERFRRRYDSFRRGVPAFGE